MTQDPLPPFNDELREGVLGLIGEINVDGLPVGGVLSYIIGLFWPTADTSEQTWKAIKKYAEEMVDKKIDSARVEDLTVRLDGLKGVAQTYKDTSFGSAQKGQHLTNLLDDLTLFEGDFWRDKNSPEQMFPLFSTFGTLWIFAKAEQALFYDKVYLEPDKDKDKHIQSLRDHIARYTAHAQTTFDSLLAWRFGQLAVDLQWVGTWGTDRSYHFTDGYDGFSVGAANRWEGELYAANRTAQINGDFVETLQALLAVAQMWGFTDPVVPKPTKQSVVSGQARSAAASPAPCSSTSPPSPRASRRSGCVTARAASSTASSCPMTARARAPMVPPVTASSPSCRSPRTRRSSACRVAAACSSTSSPS